MSGDDGLKRSPRRRRAAHSPRAARSEIPRSRCRSTIWRAIRLRPSHSACVIRMRCLGTSTAAPRRTFAASAW